MLVESKRQPRGLLPCVKLKLAFSIPLLATYIGFENARSATRPEGLNSISVQIIPIASSSLAEGLPGDVRWKPHTNAIEAIELELK